MFLGLQIVQRCVLASKIVDFSVNYDIAFRVFVIIITQILLKVLKNKIWTKLIKIQI